MYFLEEHQVSEIIRKELDSGGRLKAAVAFWGDGAAQLLNIASHPKSVSIVCNLLSGGTNPKEIRTLKKLGVQVRHRSDLHAKVYLFKDFAIVGSSNASTRGLSWEEGISKTWREANILVDEPQALKQIKIWFKKINDNAAAVKKAHLTEATENWSRRARSLPLLGTDILCAAATDPSQFEGRRVYVVLTDTPLDDSETEAREEARTTLSADNGIVDCYGSWPDMPTDAYLIDFYLDENNRLSSEGIYLSPSDLIEVKTKNNTKIQICFETSSAFGLGLGNKSRWTKAVRKMVHSKHYREGYCTCMPLETFAREFLTETTST